MNRIYFDHNATCPPTKEHLSELFEKFNHNIANPSSPHFAGRAASVALTEARRFVAKALEVDVAELIFVSGGTEANNLATVGVLKNNSVPINKQHVITSAFEHPAIREPLEYLKLTENLNLSILSVENLGFINFEDFIKNLTPQTTLVTIMAANNEIGTIQPVKKIADFLYYKRWGILNNPDDKNEFDHLSTLIHEKITTEVFQKIHFHVDAVQIFGKIETNKWFSPGIDSCAISGHKLGSLQGIGALFLRRGRKFKPFILGGAQEKNRRAGSENLPGIISFGLVAKGLFTPEYNENLNNMNLLRKKFYQEISLLPNVILNSPIDNVIPNTINFSVIGKKYKGEDLLVELDMQGVCASSGSACSSGTNLASKVILSLGKTVEVAKNAIRISLGSNNTEEEVNFTINILKKYLI